MKRALTAAAFVAGLALSVSNASAALMNPGSELGLAGWNTLGGVTATPSTSVTTFDGTIWQIFAYETLMAELNSDGASAAVIDPMGVRIAAGALPE